MLLPFKSCCCFCCMQFCSVDSSREYSAGSATLRGNFAATFATSGSILLYHCEAFSSPDEEEGPDVGFEESRSKDEPYRPSGATDDRAKVGDVWEEPPASRSSSVSNNRIAGAIFSGRCVSSLVSDCMAGGVSFVPTVHVSPTIGSSSRVLLSRLKFYPRSRTRDARPNHEGFFCSRFLRLPNDINEFLVFMRCRSFSNQTPLQDDIVYSHGVSTVAAYLIANKFP